MFRFPVGACRWIWASHNPGATTLPGGQEIVETSIPGQLDCASVCRRRGFCRRPVSVLFKPFPKCLTESELQERLSTPAAEQGGCISCRLPADTGLGLSGCGVFILSHHSTILDLGQVTHSLRALAYSAVKWITATSVGCSQQGP